MKADNKTTPHNRTILFTDLGIPESEQLPTELTVTVNYVGDSNAHKGVTIDKYVVPAIVKAFTPPKGNTELLGQIIDLMKSAGIKMETPYDFENWIEDHAKHSHLFKTKRFTDSKGE